MVQPTKSPLAWAHQFPPPLPEGISPDGVVLIRYDGARINDHDVIYAVLGEEDLKRLPAPLIEGLEFSVRDRHGDLRGNPDAFFIGSERQLSLYVNTDVYPDFVKEVQSAAFQAGLLVADGQGDLQYMKGPDGDITAPDVPAFVENGLGYVPSLLAISYLDKVRPDHGGYSGPDCG